MSNADAVANVTMEQDRVLSVLDDAIHSLDDRLVKSYGYLDSATMQRQIQLNQNFSKRYYAYLKMVWGVVLALVLIFVAKMVARYFNLDDNIVTGVIVLAMSAAIIWCIMVYTDMRKRDPTDFDRIDPPPPPGMGSDSKAGTNLGAGAGGAGMTTCLTIDGQSCVKERFTNEGSSKTTVSDLIFGTKSVVDVTQTVDPYVAHEASYVTL